MSSLPGRRTFLAGLGAAALTAGCRAGDERGRLVLRLSHSMSASVTALHVFAAKFRELSEAATGGAVAVRIFPSNTLGQEREVVQQVQEGLVDFMVSGTAIWGSVAPKLQVFDFPFMWRDWDHVHQVVDGPSDGTRRTTSIDRADASDRVGRFVRVSERDHAFARGDGAWPFRRAETPDDSVANLREGRRAHGRESHTDGVR